MATQSRFVANKGLDNNNKTIVNVTNPVNQSDVSTRSHFSDASNLASGTLDMARIPDMATMFAKSSNGALIKPSLNLNFAKSNTLDSRITFTRASSATRVNRNGLIEVVGNNVPRFDYDPFSKVCKGLLIEEQRTNLLTYSNNFDNSIWTKTRSYVTPNVLLAPDGSFTGYKFIEGTQLGSHYIASSNIAATIGSTYTLSIYAKAGEKSLLTVGDFTSNSLGYAVFNLLTGVATTVTGSASISQLNNGWYKCTYTTIAAIDSSIDFGVGLTNSTSTSLPSYTGDGVSGIYIWGAQLETGAFATSYIPSTNTFTSRASTATYIGSDGLIKTAAINTARLNYTPTNLSVSPQLLLEAASTNLLTYSEQFDNAVWTKTRSTITSNAIIAPDGLQTADKLIEDSSVGTHYCRNGANLIANTTYTISVYAKAAERSLFYIGIGTTTGWATSGGATFDLLSGSITVGNSDVIAKTKYVGNGWYLCSLTKLKNSVDSLTTFDINLLDISSGNGSYTGDGVSGVYIWGAQLEQSSFASSYIPTTSAQVTRAADVSSSAQSTRAADTASITGNNFTSWINQTEGTITFDGDFNYSKTTADYPRLVSLVGTNANNDEISIYTRTTGVGVYSGMLWGGITVNGTATMDTQPSNQTILGDGKGALAYKTNNSVIVANGLVATPYTLVALPTKLTELRIFGTARYQNQPNGHIREIKYYPQRLPNATLQSLTA